MLASIGRTKAEIIRECAYIRQFLPVVEATSGNERQVDGGQKSRRRSAHVRNRVDDAGGRSQYGSVGVIAVRVFELQFASHHRFTGTDDPVAPAACRPVRREVVIG